MVLQSTDQLDAQYNGTWGNLQLLLNLPPGPRILILGSRFFSGMKWLPHAEYHDSLDAGEKDLQYDFILLHTQVAKSKKDLFCLMSHAANRLNPHGALMIFARNFYSLSSIMKFKGLTLNSVSGYIRFGYHGYNKLFQAVGPAVQYNLLPMPSLFSAEEYISVGCDLIEVPYYSNVLNRLAHCFGKYHLLHEGFAFLKVNERLEDNGLFTRIGESISNHLRKNETKLMLERLDTRLRGATVIFVRDQISNTSYIVRIVSGMNAQGIVKKNHSFLTTIRSSDEIGNAIKRVLPRPIDYFTFGNAHIYIETKIPGILAWKVNKKGLRDKIYRNSIDLLTTLQVKTKKSVILDDSFIEQLLYEDQQRILLVAGYKDKLDSSLNRVVQAINKHIHGKEICLSVAHGDYGYGNIMVDPMNGELTGVIDWDTGKQFDFPGIDIINLQVQKARSEEQLGIAEAFIKVGSKIIQRGFIDEYGIYTQEFGLNREMIKGFVLIAIIRFMGRAAQYADIFNRDLDEYLQLMEYVSSEWIELQS